MKVTESTWHFVGRQGEIAALYRRSWRWCCPAIQLLVAAGFVLNSIFYILAAIAVVGVILTLLVPIRRTLDLHSTPIEPSVKAGRGEAQASINPTA